MKGGRMRVSKFRELLEHKEAAQERQFPLRHSEGGRRLFRSATLSRVSSSRASRVHEPSGEWNSTGQARGELHEDEDENEGGEEGGCRREARWRFKW